MKNGAIIASGVKSMLISTLGGIIFALIVCNIDYEIISKLWPIVAAGCIGLMVITLLFGKAVNPDRPDAKSWLDLGVFYFQTSELLKVGFIISFSYHLDMVKDKLNRVKTIIPLVIHGMIPIGLVLLNVITDDELMKLDALANQHGIPLVIDNAGSAAYFPCNVYRNVVLCQR